MYTLIRSCFVH